MDASNGGVDFDMDEDPVEGTAAEALPPTADPSSSAATPAAKASIDASITKGLASTAL